MLKSGKFKKMNQFDVKNGIQIQKNLNQFRVQKPRFKNTNYKLFFKTTKMQNQLLGSILNNIVMQKVVRDKIVMQQKQQRQEEIRKRKQGQVDEFDEFEDEETKEIMRKMKQQRLDMQESIVPHKRQEKRVIGQYREINQDEFLNYVTKLKHTVVHFFHKEFQRCQIMDKHLKILCEQFPNTQFLSVNAEKTPFFVERLGIRTLPTLCIFIDGVLKDKVLGFQGLSGDEFLTYELAAKLAESGVIEIPKGGKAKDKTILKGDRRGNNSDQENDD